MRDNTNFLTLQGFLASKTVTFCLNAPAGPERPKGAMHPQGTPGGTGRASGAYDRGDGDGPNGNSPNGGSLAH